MGRNSRQLGLDLRERARWGGRRAGAGRECGPSPRHAHRTRRPLASRFPCHATLKVKRGLPSLRSGRLVRELESSFAAACERGAFRLVHYSIQNDHMHAMVEAASARDLACRMKSLGSRLARAVNRVFRLHGPVLADRYHLHVLRTSCEVRHALAYVLLNARRHLAKRGHRPPPHPEVDPASSGRWFSGWNRRFQPASSLDPPPVALPRTWLLSVGWRRHGLISPADENDSRAR